MKTKTYFLFTFFLTTFIISCTSGDKKKEITKEEPVQIVDTAKAQTKMEPVIEKTETDTEEYKPSDEEIREYGIIESIEDGAYPFFSVTVDFVERNMKQSFSLNIEAISIDSETLLGLKGKYATIYYTSDLINDLSDLYFENKSLSGEYAPEMDESWEKITGILNGAESLSGDLPSKISVTDANGEKMNFKWFVDDDIQKVNKKIITAYYTSKVVNTITHIQPSSGE